MITFAATVSACEKAGVEGDEFGTILDKSHHFQQCPCWLTHLAICGYLLI